MLWCSCSLSLSVVMSSELRTSALSIRRSSDSRCDLFRNRKRNNRDGAHSEVTTHRSAAFAVNRTGSYGSNIKFRFSRKPRMAYQLVPLPDKPPTGQHPLSSLHCHSSLPSRLDTVQHRRGSDLDPPRPLETAETPVGPLRSTLRILSFTEEASLLTAKRLSALDRAGIGIEIRDHFIKATALQEG